jgi:glycosyltransferase involved in cell wall biosynthesis
METVTAIIPVHNRPRMLREALESVRAQSSPADEVIVIDDGSDDATPKAAREFEEVRLITQPRRGASAARNAGIALARSDLIAFLDSDDYWQPDKLRIQREYMERHANLSICHTEETWIRNGRRVNPGSRYRKHGGRVFRHCLDTCFIALSTTMIRRDLFDEVGLFDEALPACEDYDLWLRISNRFEIGFIDEPLTTRREGHPEQLSHTVPFLDIWRIEALFNLLQGPRLLRDDRVAALDVLESKARIVLRGLVKKQQNQQAKRLRSRIERIRKECQ